MSSRDFQADPVSACKSLRVAKSLQEAISIIIKIKMFGLVSSRLIEFPIFAIIQKSVVEHRAKLSS